MRPARGIVVLLAVLAVSAGCLGTQGSDERAEAVIDRTSTAMNDIDAVQWSVEGSATAERGDETASVTITGEGRVDYTTNRSVFFAEGEGTRTWIALANRTTYAACPAPPQADTPDAWYAGEQLYDDMSFRDASSVVSPRLLDISTFEYGGNETIDGTVHHRIVVHPDVNDYEAYKQRAIYPGQQGATSRGQSYENVTVTVLVANDTSRVRSVTVEERLRDDGVTIRTSVAYDLSYDSPSGIELGRTVDSREQCHR